MNKPLVCIPIVSLLLLAQPTSAQPYFLVENFTNPLSSSPNLRFSADFDHPKVGLAAARLEYRFRENQNSEAVSFANEQFRIPGPGQLKIWVKGDKSGNQLQFVFHTAEVDFSQDGRRHLGGVRGLPPMGLTLDFEGWREAVFEIKDVQKRWSAWWAQLVLQTPSRKDAVREGVLLLDDLRLYSPSERPQAAFSAKLIGDTVRDYAEDIAFALDLRSFVDKRTTVQARVTMTDRNENLVVDRDLRLELLPEEGKEVKFDLKPENLDGYLPPFRLKGDVLSTDLPNVSATIDHTLVMGNALVLVDDFGNPYGRWFTAGLPSVEGGLVGWTMGESQRASPFAQTTAWFSRAKLADIPPPQPAGGDETGKDLPRPAQPPGRYALQVDYTGSAVVFNGFDRDLIGNAYRLGVWVRGNGTEDRLKALILDYTDGGDFWVGGWKRIGHGVMDVCALNFQGWRYFEFGLPGNGVGTNLPRGSTDDLDFPLELTYFLVETRKPDERRTLHIGPVFAHTQVQAAGTLALHVGYDDPNHSYGPDRNAWATVQNGRWVAKRKVELAWSLLDRQEEVVAKGQKALELAGREQAVYEIDLKVHSAEANRRLGPLKLQVVASDKQDVAVSATREIVLSKPDSEAFLTGFETDRGFIQLWAGSVLPHQARTSNQQAHSGKQSLSVAWEKSEKPQDPRQREKKGKDDVPDYSRQWVPVEPLLPGVPTELSLWLYGDESGVLFHPLMGSRRGVRHGAGPSQFNLYHPRTIDMPLQDAVTVDWKGWRHLTFRLPVIPPTWPQDVPIPRWVASYPLGLHLALDATSAKGMKGVLHFDDISVTTHLSPDDRLDMELQHTGESNIVPPGDSIQAWLANRDVVSARKATVSGGLYDWRDERVAGSDLEVELKPGERRLVTIAGGLKPGFYLIRLDLKADGKTLRSVREDILVSDFQSVLGKDWTEQLKDEWKLRRPVKDSYTFVDEDWDWVEHYAGNLQVDTIRGRAQRVRQSGADPYMLLGYGAYWAAGEGFQAMMASSFERRQRDVGHAVDTFLKPERLEDWDSYCCELMRGVGKELSGWILWDNPEGKSSLGVEPPRFAQFIKTADKWRRAYCPATPLIIGGMNRDTAVPYLKQLAEQDALSHITGVNVRMDVGRLSPEDARIEDYARGLMAVLNSAESAEKRTVLLTDLDWAVEKDPAGLDGFDQAAYLVRSDLLLQQLGIQPVLSIRNDDYVRLGLGLTYKTDINIPPMSQKLPSFRLKPAWWAIYRTRRWLEQLEGIGEVEIQDVIPGNTRCLLYRQRTDGKPVAILWRNDEPGHCTFAGSGLSVESAEDMFGVPVPGDKDWFRIGKLPSVFVFGKAENPSDALARLRVREVKEHVWPQQTVAAFAPSKPGAQVYEQKGGKVTTWQGQRWTGEQVEHEGQCFERGGSEKFQVPAPKDADLVLRKRYFLDEQGQQMEVVVNEQAAGRWNLRRSDPKLSQGFREAIFLVDRKLFSGRPQAEIELRYENQANTIAWRVLEYHGGDFPLSAVGPVHADQNVAHPFIARNVIGSPIRIGEATHGNGIGVFARSLLEYSLNGQFVRFTAKVGIDAATEGKGSVEFEAYADGRKVWSSGVMSGLDEAKPVSVEVKGVDRLRLVVTDGGDGNKFDAANWCEPALHR